MGRFDTVKTAIDANVNTNGNQEITGAVMNSILNQMMDATDSSLTSEAASLQGQISTSSTKIASLENSMSQASVYLQNHENAIAALREEDDAIIAKNEEQDGRLSTLENDMNQAETYLQNHENAIAALQEQISANAIPLQSITYAELIALRDAQSLTPGMQYRITDYVTTTTQANTRSANHQFDLIVIADDESTLNEKARAIQHDGDDYFANSDLAAWEIWYCLDNDTNRFAWADTENGKGVIYRMIDEWNNDAPYDFKNIIYIHASTFECSIYGVSHTYTKNGDIITIGGVNYYGYTRTRTGSGPPPPPTPLYVTETTLSTSMTLYTIASEVASPYTSASVNSVVNKDGDVYTFGETSDLSVKTSTIYSNTISPYFVQSVQTLNRNTFGNNCYNNSFGGDCYDNSFGDNCYRNSFGNGCNSNSFGNGCQSNSFGNNCYNNSFGNSCTSNSFGGDCYDNSFGDNCYRNSFGNGCYNNSFGNFYNSNSFGDNCTSNSFGNSCASNSFGNSCNNNTFGDGYTYNSFGNSCSSNSFGDNCTSNSFGNSCASNSFGNSCFSNSFGDGCFSNSLDDGNESPSTRIQYYKFANGTSDAEPTITRGLKYETMVARDSEGNLKVFCLADLVTE